MQTPFLSTAPAITFHRSMQPVEAPVFSILIPTWNNLALLKTCVSSLRKNSRYQHQIILHLNECTDGTKEWAEQEGLDYSHSEENIGICYAMNLARTLARTDLLVYFNDDMYACPDWDFWLYEEVKKQGSPYYFLSTTMIEPRSSGNACALAPFDFGSHPDNFDEVGLLASFSQPEKADWQGATWPPSLITTQVWDMVGGYSTEFSPGMYSDPDFSMKLWHAGVRYFKGLGKSRVYHFMSKSTGKLNKKRVNGARIFLHKWGVSSNLFSRFYLHRGEVWDGVLQEPELTLKFKLKALLSDLKRRFS